MTRGDVASEISKKEVLVVVSNSQDRNSFFHFRFAGTRLGRADTEGAGTSPTPTTPGRGRASPTAGWEETPATSR